VVIGGPQETLTYLHGLEPANWLLDTTWAEGGILLDTDAQTLIFWGGSAINRRPDLRRLLLLALRLIWPGWNVSWATWGTCCMSRHIENGRRGQTLPHLVNATAQRVDIAALFRDAFELPRHERRHHPQQRHYAAIEESGLTKVYGM